MYQGIQSKLLIKWGKNIEAKHAFTDKCHTKFTSSLSCYVGNVYLIIHVITVSYKTLPRLQFYTFIPPMVTSLQSCQKTQQFQRKYVKCQNVIKTAICALQIQKVGKWYVRFFTLKCVCIKYNWWGLDLIVTSDKNGAIQLWPSVKQIGLISPTQTSSLINNDTTVSVSMRLWWNIIRNILNW